MKLVDWACEVELKFMLGGYPYEKPPMLFTHRVAWFILMLWAFLFELGFISDE